MQRPWGRNELGLFKEQEVGQCGWSRESEEHWGRQGQIMPGRVAMVTSLDFILITTGSYRKVSNQGNDRYDLSLRKTTQAAVVRKLRQPGPQCPLWGCRKVEGRQIP